VFFSNLPHWVVAVLVVVGIVVTAALNNRISDWCRSNYPWMFRPKVMLATFALGLAIIALGLWINPPSKVREDLQRAHPEFSKPASPNFKSGQ
jgi:putative copper export protein